MAGANHNRNLLENRYLAPRNKLSTICGISDSVQITALERPRSIVRPTFCPCYAAPGARGGRA